MPVAIYDPATGDLLGTSKTLLQIYNELTALTTQQRAAIWADFTSGNPPKWSLVDGAFSPAIAALSVMAIDCAALLNATQLAKAQTKMVAVYLYEKPLYLVNPSFDANINIAPYVP